MIHCGELHASRIPREHWAHRLRMAKALGLNTVSTYVFWSRHEPAPGQFDWSGENDLAEFCRQAQREGLQVLLRPGPYVCGEYDLGGLPWWLLRDREMRLRSQHPGYLSAVRRYYKALEKPYLVHGGTSFGFTAGANNPPFRPTPTSYDYGAPVGEAGRPTPNFQAIREVMARHLPRGQALPPIPLAVPSIALPAITFRESAPVLNNLPGSHRDRWPKTMELLGQVNLGPDLEPTWTWPVVSDRPPPEGPVDAG